MRFEVNHAATRLAAVGLRSLPKMPLLSLTQAKIMTGILKIRGLGAFTSM